MDSLESIKDAAAKWFARRGGEDWSAADEAQLSRWLNASTGNLVAYLRVEAAWKEADRLKALGAGFAKGYVPNVEDFRASPFFKHVAKEPPASASLHSVPRERHRARVRLLSFGSIAASLAVITAGLWAWKSWSGSVAYSTPIGVTAAVPLPDGSKVTLNTDSEIRVAVNAEQRRVELQQGEAFFEVAPDPLRPFIVSAGDKRIVVLGTQFSVKRDRGDLRVVVTEGKVALGPNTIVQAGGIAQAKGGQFTVRERPLPEAEELLSWRSGYIVFHETSLADAVAEFNRYNTRKFIIEDPALAGIGISGNFRATNVDSFVRILEDGFSVTIGQRGDNIVLSAR